MVTQVNACLPLLSYSCAKVIISINNVDTYRNKKITTILCPPRWYPLADPEGGLRGLQPPPPLNFQKRGVTSVAVVISTVSTVSEQERNGQGRRDVGKSVHVRQAIMHLDAYHVRRWFVQKTANKVVYNDGKRLIFAYPFLDVAALMDLLYIQSSPPQSDHIILTISLVFLCFFGVVLFLLVLISSMVGFVYMSEITYFVFLIKFPIWLRLWIFLLYVLSMILKLFPDIIYFKCIYI